MLKIVSVTIDIDVRDIDINVTHVPASPTHLAGLPSLFAPRTFDRSRLLDRLVEPIYKKMIEQRHNPTPATRFDWRRQTAQLKTRVLFLKEMIIIHIKLIFLPDVRSLLIFDENLQ